MFEKYERRIIRFYKLLASEDFKIFYIGADRKYNDIELINECLKINGCQNFKVLIINYQDYSLTDDKYTWHRNYIPWEKLFKDSLPI